MKTWTAAVTPEGLEGSKLHIFSRIVRIADAFNTATSHNVFKEAKSSIRAFGGKCRWGLIGIITINDW